MHLIHKTSALRSFCAVTLHGYFRLPLCTVTLSVSKGFPHSLPRRERLHLPLPPLSCSPVCRGESNVQHDKMISSDPSRQVTEPSRDSLPRSYFRLSLCPPSVCPVGRTCVLRGPDLCGPRAMPVWPTGRAMVVRPCFGEGFPLKKILAESLTRHDARYPLSRHFCPHILPGVRLSIFPPLGNFYGS